MLNPYEEPVSSKFRNQLCSGRFMTGCIIATTLQDIHLELAKEAAAEAACGIPAMHKMSLTAFLMAGLDI